MGDPRLSRRARQAMGARTAELYLSAASVWEMAIKVGLGRLSLPAPLPDYLQEKMDMGFRILPVEWPTAARVATLPLHHRDPFDRLIIAHGLTDRVPIVSGDTQFRLYGASIIW